MIFSLASLLSAAVLVLPLASVANPVPANNDDGSLLEARTWHYPKTHKVTVGAWGKLMYDPEYVKADVGDYVKFEFHPKNHTVTESSFNSPCSKLTDAHGNQLGFRTGFIPVPADKKSHFPTRTFKVTDKKPHWFYCGQTGHCPAGMVFAVNPPHEGNTFAKFKDMAKSSGNPFPAPAILEEGGELGPRGNWHYPKTHRVTVGAWGKLAYDPEYVNANVGDYIKFEFHPKNHTVTESSFNSPCSKLTDPHGNQLGFRTGFIPVPADQKSHFPTRTFKVTDKKPHWFYCGQTGHCPAGMVFAVNPPHQGNTFAKFKDMAKSSGK